MRGDSVLASIMTELLVTAEELLVLMAHPSVLIHSDEEYSKLQGKRERERDVVLKCYKELASYMLVLTVPIFFWAFLCLYCWHCYWSHISDVS